MSSVPLRDNINISTTIVNYHDNSDRKRPKKALGNIDQLVTPQTDNYYPERELKLTNLFDLIEVEELQTLMDTFYKLVRLPVRIVDLNGRLLVSVGWRDICSEFHKAHPETPEHCDDGERQVLRDLHKGEPKLCKCSNNMWDIAMPIVVDEQPLGSVLFGQFFFEDELLDYKFFRSQALQYGFDEKEYLSALETAPRVSRETVEISITFLMQLVEMISKLCYSKTKLIRLSLEYKQNEKSAQLSRLYRVLSKINEAIVRIREPKKLFEETCRIAVEDGQFVMAWIGLADPATKLIKVIAKYGLDDGYLEKVRISVDKATPEGLGPTGIALREGQVFVNNDTENNPTMKPWQNEQLKRGYRASASFPFIIKGQTVGVITLYAHKANYFNDDQIQLLQSLASDVSFAVETADIEEKRTQAVESLRKARDELEARVQERTANLETIHKITKIATCSLDIVELKEHLLENLAKSLEFKLSTVYFFNEQYQELVPSAFFGYPPKCTCTRPPLNINSDSLVAGVLKTGEPMFIEDMYGASLSKTTRDSIEKIENTIDKQLKSVIVLPLKTYRRTIGVITFTWSRVRTFSQEDVAFFSSIAHEIAVGFENARLYEAEKKKAEELAEHRKSLEKTIQARTQEIRDINAELRQSEAQHRQIIEASPDAYFVLIQNEIVYANPAALQLFGSKDISKIDITTLKNLIVPEKHKELGNAKDSHKSIHLGEITIVKEEGQTVTVEGLVIPVVFEEEIAYQYIIRDITQRKEFEKEMARLERLNLVGEMAAGIGHEIRNPMTTVRGFLEILGGKKDCEKYKEYYDLMIDELDRANSIITEFLKLSRNKTVDKKLYNLNDIIQTLLPLIQSDAMKNDQYIVLKLEEIPDLFLNEKEIRQVIFNLVRNGLEASPKGSYLTIRSFKDNNDVVLGIQDNGEGISPNVLQKIGTPFFTTKENGTGLGLAVCYSIAACHNAKIEIESGKDGTTFFIRFKQTEQCI